MSRSYRKTPIFGITCSDSEKYEKRIINRKFRKKTKDMIQKGNYEKLPFNLNQIEDVWSMSKDGKYYWNEAPLYYMRK